MLLRFLTQRILFSILFVFCFLALIASFPSFYPKTSPFGSFHPQSASPNDGPDELKSGGRCKALSSKSEDILVVVKTGANEIYDKLPTQLLTALECYTDLLVFSDLDQRIGPYRIHDALDNVTEAAKLHNPVFDYYRSVQEYQQYGQDIGLLRKTGQAAWNLDKYKFLHMLEKSWKMKPGRKWYIFIEADTYLVRSNLLLWLDRLDPSKPLYLGSPTYYNGEAFAHGGSGIILSGAAMSRFADGDPGVAARYDEAMKDEIYGDYMLMKALRDKGVEFSNRWPMLQAEKPATIPFGPGPDNGVRHWCQPIVTMHHITPNEASIIWGFERQRPDITKPLLLQELYEDFIQPHVHAEREDWYNLSDDIVYRPPGVEGDRQKSREDMTPIEKDAHKSFEHCGRACEEQSRCFQYVYYSQTCGFSYSYRLGTRRLPEDGTSYKSGWNMAKIAQDQAAYPCPSPEWL